MNNCPNCGAKEKYLKVKDEGIWCGVCGKTHPVQEPKQDMNVAQAEVSISDIEKHIRGIIGDPAELIRKQMEVELAAYKDFMGISEAELAATATGTAILQEQRREARARKAAEELALRPQEPPSPSEAVFLDGRVLKVYGEPVINAVKTSEGVFLWTRSTLYLL